MLDLYTIADGHRLPEEGDPQVIICMEEFGPLNLQPHPGRHWALQGCGTGDPDHPRRRRRATYHRPHWEATSVGRLDLSTSRLYGHIYPRKTRTRFLRFCRYLRSLHPPGMRIGIVLDNFSPHCSIRTDGRVGAWAVANKVEFTYVPFYSSWLNPHRGAVYGFRYFALNGTDCGSHREQGRMLRWYIAWRNNHTTDPKLRNVVARTSIIKGAKVTWHGTSYTEICSLTKPSSAFREAGQGFCQGLMRQLNRT